MAEPVEDGGCDDGAAEDLAPVGQSPVGGDDGGVLFVVAQVDDLVERGGGRSVHWQQADVVDHEDRWCGVGLELRREVALAAGLGDVRDHLFGVGELAAVAIVDRECGERDCEVGLAATRLAQEQHGSSGFHEPQRGQVINEAAVDARLEVEVLDGLGEREPGVAQRGGEPPVAGRVGLLRDESCEELDMGPVLGPGGLGEGWEALGCPVELEVAEVVFDLVLDAHS